MRIIVFFLSDEHPGPLISNYLAAFGKGSTLPETSDVAGICWEACHSAGELNEARGRLPAIFSTLPTTPAIFFQTTWIICVYICMEPDVPRHNRAYACAD